MITLSRTFAILLWKRASVDAALLALSARCARKSLPPITWTWGKVETTESRNDVGEVIKTSRIPLTIVGEPPRYAGWAFLAALQHLDGENITRTVPGAELPPEYRTRGPVCEHCRQNRRRNETYVLRHDDGRMIQVGSTCIADFLGSDDAGKIASAATMIAVACSIGEEGEGGGSGVGSDFALAEYLPIVAWCVRERGWVSRTVARERGDAPATADQAIALLNDAQLRRKVDCVPTAEDVQLSQDAEQWAESLTDEAVNAAQGDYLHNLRAIARTGVTTYKTLGIAASMIVAYEKHLGRERARKERAARPELNVHIGTVGKRETFAGLVLDFVTGYSTDYGYTTVLKFRTAEGVCLVWKATNTDLARADVGKTYDVTGTVKKHDEYKGQKQTLLTRCKVSEVTSK